MATIVDTSTLSTTAAAISGLTGAMLFFRLQRELHMQGKSEIIWVPWADRQLIGALLLSLLLVLLPLGVSEPGSWAHQFLPTSACAAALVLAAFYPFSILAHYQLILANGRTLPRTNPEPSERVLVILSFVIALMTAVAVALIHAP